MITMNHNTTVQQLFNSSIATHLYTTLTTTTTTTGTTKRPLTPEELKKRTIFATAVIACFSSLVIFIVIFVTYNHLKAKWVMVNSNEIEEEYYLTSASRTNGDGEKKEDQELLERRT